MAAWGPSEEGQAPSPGSCGHGLQVALQLTHGGLVQGEEIEVKGGVGDIEVAGLLNQVDDLEGGGRVASGSRKLVWGGLTLAASDGEGEEEVGEKAEEEEGKEKEVEGEEAGGGGRGLLRDACPWPHTPLRDPAEITPASQELGRPR